MTRRRCCTFYPTTSRIPKKSMPKISISDVARKNGAVCQGLKDKELVIYRERLLNEDPLTLREIGDKYGISRERVRQIEERVKKKLKDLSEQRIQRCHRHRRSPSESFCACVLFCA